MFLVVANDIVPEETNVVAGENQDFRLIRNVFQHVSIVKSKKIEISEILILTLGKNLKKSRNSKGEKNCESVFTFQLSSADHHSI